ncbi:DUF3558 domain-containing protein [Nocardia sp. CNY236]|uniref:DUF3558 domain-containing protein n=1 Tax=Nocardia sp. CNY236 TaxID=1169152 RepID=UPI00041266B9|nr:DUF3558 domain-containing protein [Nocardia sp. CNY236]
MRIKSAVALAAASLLTLAACGSGGEQEIPGSSPPAPKVLPLGPFVGECGHVTDDEVRDLGGFAEFSSVFRNAVGCNWVSAGIDSRSITFASYRASPIEREREWVIINGRPPESITVAGREGFAAMGPDGRICDLAVQLGDDFFEWSTALGFSNLSMQPENPCDRSRALAELTVQRLQ